ncbi:type II secretion system F family protein [Pseudidiomarina terrestris]|uniref:Type II secretion system F family protein n=1 Tax=Pseudidiomarina terrestris TaxID=2820060 RepID=A0ABT8MHM3_9GAMM|nr:MULTISPECIES: type II secretion system F family protein [unclassified Pseudidiomarina]MDN7129438.1 type II secretion system F family protein [Pseudidiomarina sp. 1APR75-15]MDN7134297.1 type II secretion system F family protein [Pseudidiomarina sp. 1ASP75-5]
MAEFSYRGRDASGELVTGALEAASERVAADTLIRRGVTPLTIAPRSNEVSRGSGLRLFDEKIDLDDLIVFTRQMYSLTKAGIPLLRAIDGLAVNSPKRRMREVLSDVVEQLERGRELSVAMGAHPKVFPRLLVAVVHVGENTGQLEEAFQQLSDYLGREQDTRKQVKSALRYPMFIVSALVVAMFILNIWVIPTFARMFEQFNAELPLPTQILIGVSNFFVNWWPLMLLAIVAAIFALNRFKTSETGRVKWDRWKTRMPIFGDIVLRSLLSRFSRSFSVMLRAGVPLTQSLHLVADAVDNYWMHDRIEDMRRTIEKGEGLTRAAQGTNLFTPLVMQMISVGEETGRVDELLNEVADYYEREVDYDLKSLTARIEPILLVLVAVMVAIMALGIFTPMWDMMDAYKGR